MDGSQIAVIVAIVVVILIATGTWGRRGRGGRRGRDITPTDAAMGGAAGYVGTSVLLDDDSPATNDAVGFDGDGGGGGDGGNGGGGGGGD